MKNSLFKILVYFRRYFNNTGIGKVPFVLRTYKYFFKNLKPSGLTKIKIHDFMILIEADEIGMAPQLLEKGVYEPFETLQVNSILKSGDVFVNIGANFGYYTLLASKLVGQTGKVYAFEPEPKNLFLLKNNVTQNNLKNVEVSDFAVSNQDGLQLDLYTDQKNIGNPSLSLRNIPNLMGHVRVQTITLDSYFKDSGLPEINLIQMDTQGSEGNIIDGAAELIQKYHPVIIMEFWPYGLKNLGTEASSLLKKMSAFGYSRMVLNEQEGCSIDLTDEEIINKCLANKNGKGFTNLLFKYQGIR